MRFKYLCKAMDKSMEVLERIGEELEDISVYIMKALKENASTTKGGFINYLNTHRSDLIIIGVGVAISVAFGVAIYSVLFDQVVWHKFTIDHEVPEHTNFFPPNKGLPEYGGRNIMPLGFSSRPLNAADFLKLSIPFLIAGATVMIEYVNLYRRKHQS